MCGIAGFVNNNGVAITVVFEHNVLNDIDVLPADYLTSHPPGEINL